MTFCFLVVTGFGMAMVVSACLHRLSLPHLFAMADRREGKMGIFNPLLSYAGSTARETQRIIAATCGFVGAALILIGIVGLFASADIANK